MAGMNNVGASREFGIAAANVGGRLDTGVVIAAVRCGATGVLNCEGVTDEAAVKQALARIVRLTRHSFAVKLDASSKGAGTLLADLPSQAGLVIFTGAEAPRLAKLIRTARQGSRGVLIEVTSVEQGRLGQELGADGFIAKGSEAGGRVGEETTFVLLQRLLAEFPLPVWAHGGIGPHSAAACYVAGATGVVLDSQLLLTPESSLPLKARAAVERMEGDETLRAGQELGDPYRLWPLGQDAAFAARLTRKFGNIAGIVRGLRESVREHVELAGRHDSLAAGAPLAQSHGTRFPVLQGPVTHVTDTAAFAQAVAAGGGLPFLALADMGAPQVRTLLADTKQLLGELPWGAGIPGMQGVVPADLRREQLAAVRETRPPFAIIAGGRPDEAADLEREGIRTYLQLHTPASLRPFLQDGARRFVIGASEGSGPASPPTSFALWETAIDLLLDAIEQGVKAEELHIVFAGGIHDSRSAAMTAAMAAPLAARGAHIGVLMGAAYLVTREAVASGATSACSIQELHEEVFGGGAARLREIAMVTERVEPECGPRSEPPCDVAIIGMGCLLPKAPNPRAFWSNVMNKIDALTEIPRERFDINLYYDADRKARDKIYSRWGGFLDDVSFDPMRYGIPPTALASIDPMQLLSLVVVDQALADAGYADKEFSRSRTSAIFGASGGLGDLGGNYAIRSWLAQCLADVPEQLLERLPEWTEDSFPGLLPNVVAGRVANRFDLGGVNFTVDAACASSLAAAYLGVRELTAGTSDMVLVGGVDTVQNPFCFLCFAKSQALSPRGKCRPFDESADGIAISEGITVLVMKRLADAERDGDRVYAVIKGIAGSSDGRGRSMTAPRPEGQKLVLKRAYDQAGFSPATIGLVEAHGTGTVAGDTAELSSLTDVMRDSGARPGSCAIGSVKSMLGHTKSAAGITGLMKIALALYHKALPPTLNVERPNAKLREPGSPIFANTIPQPWIPPDGVARRAGVSSFGFGGTNFHAVVEEYQGELRDPADFPGREEWPAELFLWNAPSPDALQPSLELIARQLESGARPLLRELAAAVCHRAGVSPEAGARLAIVATSFDDLKGKLARARAAVASGEKIADAQGVYLDADGPRPKVAFLFPGQGSQKPGMLCELALHFPEFRQSLELAGRVLAGRLPLPLSGYIYPPPAFTPEDEREQMRALTDTVVAQPALGTVEAALAKLLNRFGVAPDMAAGHSYGEYVALWAAGVFAEETLVDLSEVRGRAIKESVQGDMGAMAAVQADAATVSEAIREIPDVIVANDNSPRQMVIAGATEAVHEAVKRLSARGLSAKILPVACAFHSALMQPARDRLAAALGRQTFSPPKLAVFSNTLGGRYPEEPSKIAALLTDHLVRPVKFTDEVRAMYDQGARIFVEVGPKGVLTGLARQTLQGTDATFIQMDSGDGQGLAHLLHALAQLAVKGVTIEAGQLFRGRMAEVPELERLLSVEAAPKPGWLVNGGHTFPRGQRPKIHEPLKLAALASAKPDVAAVPHQVDLPAAPVQATAPTPVSARSQPAPQNGPTMPVTPSHGNLEAVMLPFQQLMSQFLQTQAAIMTAYLQGAPADDVPLPAIPAPIAMPFLQPPAAVAAPVVARTAHVEQESAAPRPPAPAKAPDPTTRRDVTGELVKIVSERTGYPAEMLAMDAAIEADLGIDSIKRVEILSSFQRLCTAEEQAALHGAMDKLTSATTLREIAERISSVLAPEGASAAKPAAIAQQTAPQATASSDVAGELVKIVSERTGYPAEMLAMDAAIEADLGIDSIKRVEILSSFQRLCTAEEQAALHGAMDKLTSATTLREIAERIASVLAPAGASVAQPAAARDVAGELVKIVSERTGYPAEMLAMDAAIEADLGIDSIKRVEILSSFQRLCTAEEQAALHGAMDKLTSATTLHEVARHITAALALEPPAESATEKTAPLARCVPVIAERPYRGKQRYYPGRVCVITDDETGIAAGLAEELQRAGEHPVLLRHSPDATLAVNGVHSTDLRDPAAIQSLIESLRAKYGRVGAVIHLLPLRAEHASVARDLAEWRERIRLDITSLYALIRGTEKDLRETGRTGGALLAAITASGGDFGLGPSAPAAPTYQAIVDFMKTAALEVPEARAKVVDLDASDPAAILQQKLVDELTSDDDTLQVGLPGDRRLVTLLRQAPLGSEALRQIAPDWVFLLTGGARGITAEIARLLGSRHRPTLILVGSTPYPEKAEASETAGVHDPARLKAALAASLRATSPSVKPADIEAAAQKLLREREIRGTVESLRELGCRVAYHAVDVRDEGAFGGLIDNIYRDFGRLDVVIHGAGIIEDKLIRDKTPESFERVLHTKADSVFILSRKLRADDLRCLLLMSSVTAAFGNRGQADYGAANGVLNGLALELAARWPAHVVSMNWGPWDHSNMVSEQVRRQFVERGVQPIPPAAGAEAALREIESGGQAEPVVVVGDGPWVKEALSEVAARALAVTRSRT
jgi:acyl transferase domain-containing protein/NAD(P)H-dependent flavin oxidoreductase YrpB (nitropropane dioxygenase family)/NAD(P)-dependent dehydrogenase (short-subunit alcohol dehydrogenase family)/acyl carrier protein